MQRRCSRCGAAKDENDFAGPFRSRPRKGIYCAPCRVAYQRKWYLDNRDSVISRSRARNGAEFHRRVGLLLEYLRKHPCTDCGENDPIVLEFDHLGAKAFTIAQGMKTRAWSAVLAEMRKCEVLCVNCHRRRTAIRGGFRRAAMARRAPLQVPLFGRWGTE